MSSSAQDIFEHLTTNLVMTHQAEAGQMFGKKCVKVNGKAAIALFRDNIVFKLPKDDVQQAIQLTGAELWDPSGKGRAMKEWVQIPIDHEQYFADFAQRAAAYVG